MPKIESKNTDLACLKKHISKAILRANKIDVTQLTDLKFKKTMRWPYPQNGTCNFIEFINQLFTTVASIKAIEYLKAENDNWVMNLGTTSGRDLTVIKNKQNIIAEIFAVTDPDSNEKLKNEILSLTSLSKEEKADKRFAFFILSEDKFPKEEQDVIHWTTYSPKTSAKDKIAIKFKEKSFSCSSKVRHLATWSALCGDDATEINVVCWSSEDCLSEFILDK
ncbi:MAG: hypothetical protein IJV93_14205 [Lentisphaeria bacterium]|nr:hypothetical protein [Lentisphaeria bacterium]